MEHITSAEKQILEVIRSLKPFEEVKIVADKDGKVNSFYVARTSKVMIVASQTIYVK